MELRTLPGVFAPISDSRLLADAIAREVPRPGATALDLGTGSGVLALAAARAGFRTTAVDRSGRALATARWNARRAGLRLQTRRGDLFAPVSGLRFDLVVSNPPYVPAPSPTVPERGPARAWAAGPDGRLVLDRLCAGVADHLAPGGRVLLVHSNLVDEERSAALLASSGLDVEIVERVRGPLGPLMREQQRLGTVDPGLDEEDVVVLRGVRV